MSTRSAVIRWKTRACVVATLVGAAAPCEPLAAAGNEPPYLASPTAWDPTTPAARHILVVRVDNLASLPDRELTPARELATGILRSAGLEPIWIACRAPVPQPSAMQVWVVLGAGARSERMLARMRAQDDLLGMMLPGTGRAYVFSERIRHFAARKRRSFEDVLGHVLAHEIGHHVLPGEGHAATGIMQSDIGDAFATAWFTPQQGRSIRALVASTSSISRGTRVERERSRELRAAPRSSRDGRLVQ